MTRAVGLAPPPIHCLFNNAGVGLHPLPGGGEAPHITWCLVVTQGLNKPRQNLGIYRQQALNRNLVIMRWQAHRVGRWNFASLANSIQ